MSEQDDYHESHDGRGADTPAWGRALTRADLDAMPDDGRKYEIIDGALIVSPAPRIRHQRAVRNLLFVLQHALPDGLELLFAPVDVVLADDTVIQPDLLVAPRTAFTERDLPVAPLLAVEVLSSSSRSIDLNLKKDRLERAGCANYWVIDPDEPSIVAWQLAGGVYRQVASAAGAQQFAIRDPFLVQFTPMSILV